MLTGHEEAGAFGVRVASWVDGAVDGGSRAALTARLTGVLTVAGPLLTVGAGALDPLLHRVVELDDTAFLARLPALRGGFDTLSPAARDRLLATVEERLGERVGALDADDPVALAHRTAADLAARDLLTVLGLPVPPPTHGDQPPPPPGPPADTRPTTPPTGTTPVRAEREPAGDTCLLAVGAEGVPVRLAAADDDPALAHRDNLMLLATAPGTRLKIIGRLVPAPRPRLILLACSHPTGEGTVDLGLDRLRRADLPDPAAPVHPAPPPHEAAGAHSPLYLLERRVEQTVLAGRAALGMLSDVTAESARLRRAGLPTAAGLLTALSTSAAHRARDHFGRLLPTDTDAFAAYWLSAARYTAAVTEALCAEAWKPPQESPAAATTP